IPRPPGPRVGPPARPALTAPRHAGEAAVVVLLALVLGGGLVLLGDPDLRGDQNAYNLLVAKKLAPDLFARDALYRHDPDVLHVPWFLDVQAALARRAGGVGAGARDRLRPGRGGA